jgi:hypothetical protein
MPLHDQLTNLYQRASDLERIVICAPGQADVIQAFLAEHNLEGLWTVRTSLICPEDRIFLLDQHAITAAITDGYRYGPGILTFPTKEQP